MKYCILDEAGDLLAILTADSEAEALAAGKQISDKAVSAKEHIEAEHEIRDR